MKYLLIALLLLTTIHASSSLRLEEAIDILKSDNLEIKSATYDIEAAQQSANAVSGNHWGKLDFIQDFSNSNDAGNVFGFKLASREATFGDFGAREFIAATTNGETPPESAYTTPAQDLNYPDSRNFFQSKLKYEVPIFTGFRISSYSDVMKSMTKIKRLNKAQVVNEKIYQIRKSFYDMSLLRTSEDNLKTILQNINTLETMTKNMIDVGYAKSVDLLEVKSKKANVQRLISQMQSNQKLLYHYISFLLNQKITDIQLPLVDIEMPKYTNDEIISSNLDIQKASSGLEVTKSMIDVSQSAYYPTIGAFGEVGTADDTFLGDASNHASYTVGARLTWNIFNAGIDKSNIEKSRLNFLKTQTKVQLATRGIELQVEKIRTEIETLNNDINSLKQELKLAEKIYKNYEGRYREKLTSMSDVIIKQSEQIQKILQLQQARNKRNERIFALEKLANGDIQ